MVVHYTRLKRLSSDKHFRLLGAFVSYEETEVLLIQPHISTTNAAKVTFPKLSEIPLNIS
jgi:hypothetical protein